MNNSMITASASMGALQQRLDMIADNIANLNTVGYKRKTSVFEDLLTSLLPQQEDFRQPGRATPLGFTQGWGVRLSSMLLDLTQGSLQYTGNPTDVAIEGNALFQVETDPNGTTAYTRNGTFQLTPTADGDRLLVTADGLPVLSEDGGHIIVPAGYDLAIAADGTLTAQSEAGTDPIALGRLSLMQVVKPELLRSIGNNLFGVDEGTDPLDVLQPLVEMPEGTGVRQGFTEQSNVDLTVEMTELLNVQRAYQLNARALASAEQMLSMANQLRG